MKRYEIEIARRIALGFDGGKSSPAVKVAVTSVALSIAVMLLAVAVIFGFKKEVTRKIEGFTPHISLYSSETDESGKAVLRPDEGLGAVLDSVPYIKEWHTSVNVLALLKRSDSFKGLYLTGVDSTFDSSFLKENLVSGKIPDFRNAEINSRQLLVSRKSASDLGLKAGDSINVYSIGDQVRVSRMEVTGIYDSHFEMYDNILAFSSANAARELGGFRPDEVTRIDITTHELKETDQSAAALHQALAQEAEKGNISPFVAIDTITSQCAGIFGWLALLDINVWIVLILLTVVSAFTLISGMLIIILEKVRFIGVMKALGAPSSSIRHIFIWLSMRIGIKGVAIGTAAGLLLISLQYWFHVVPLNPDAYYMDYAPVEFCWWAFAAVIVGFSLCIYLTLELPSRLVSRISPSESMRFE